MKKRGLAGLLSLSMAAGLLGAAVSPVTVMADDVEEITWMFWDDLEATEDLIVTIHSRFADTINRTEL